MFTEIEARQDDVTWQPSLLAIDEPDFDPALDGRPAALPRARGVGRRGARLGHRCRRAVRHRARVGAVEGLRASDVRPRRRRAAARDAGCGTTDRRSSTGWPRCLGRRYGVRLPSISANLYRDGRDSVAWHGDRIGDVRSDAVVAILSLGSTRTLLLRPDGGGPSIAFPMRSGDLLVQGGTCQRTFEHCVPKRAHAGPRISVMFRQAGGN